MQQSVEAPTPHALADLVARCDQINRYLVAIAAAEEMRIAALASGILVMRNVLALETVPPDKLPPRQQHIEHWALVGDHLAEAETPAIRHLKGVLVLDEHEQVKILSHKAWRGPYRLVTLWRHGVHDLTTTDLMEYLASLAALAHRRAPDVARSLLERSKAIEATRELVPFGPRGRAD